ncbi:uncharacterized protein [Nerophis lumbriciformis]|uniref:uncharacterized protein n=1 Tax=Nerophis lumbriciformis TaxID=546530 RepID=UPI002AE053B8|nr:uncharacterized protein LOC133608789 [Nerophis lumbriciformis]XP_061820301.1 uncharacterized protein LOC133608789 [Nerophis lumbriciformis]XP_061820302.1 uncharacterized protein LOC133608789 [Nerophis lumbriciformis]
MSVEIFSASPPAGNNESLQANRVGGSKPLHRFMKAQPQSVGVAVVILGVSFIIASIIMAVDHPAHHLWRTTPLGYITGIKFIACGVLYIITEHNPTKKTVTASLALSIVTIIFSSLMIFFVIPNIENHYDMRSFDIYAMDNTTATIEDDTWVSQAEALGITTAAIFIFYVFVGLIIVLVMSVLAGAALRSTKTQATVVLSTIKAQTPDQ